MLTGRSVTLASGEGEGKWRVGWPGRSSCLGWSALCGCPRWPERSLRSVQLVKVALVRVSKAVSQESHRSEAPRGGNLSVELLFGLLTVLRQDRSCEGAVGGEPGVTLCADDRWAAGFAAIAVLESSSWLLLLGAAG